ncbi:unnamed protein product [Rhizophagus irregularis]|nr:unnamed protein product [Rhizophagus irregularis]
MAVAYLSFLHYQIPNLQAVSQVVNCQPAVPNIIVKYSSWLWFLFIPNTLNTKKTDSLVLSERCQGSKNGNNHPKVFLVFLRTTIAIFGVGDYVWVPWSTIVNSISIKVKNELSRKIRGNRLVFQHVGELF